MRSLLQKFDFRSSSYERPNQTWVCGRLAEGNPCRLGPDTKGACHADFECQPLKKDDRWHCARSELAGGRCLSGPLPDGTCCRAVPRCRPVMSWRARPGAVGKRVAALTLGLLLILLAGSSGGVFLNPGPLTFQHGGITDCAGCHTTADKGPTGWLRAAFAESADVADSERCLACHDFGANKFEPHNLSPAALTQLTRDVNASTAGTWAMAASTAAMLFTPPHRQGRALSCNTCHQEHHGNTHDLAAMANDRCQSCHTFQFSSLQWGHPEFFDYPYKRRTRIIFDHASHFGKHFPEAAKKDPAQADVKRDCSNCHRLDASGRTMHVDSFEQTCASCHGAQVAGAGRASAKGLAVFRVPGLDAAALAERGVAVGHWSEDADEAPTPMMDFLLSGDPGHGADRKVLAGLDLLDLIDANDAQTAAAGRFAWRVKGLLSDLSARGVPALKRRLEAALGRQLSEGELIDLVGLLPLDAMRAYQGQWFPGLDAEVAAHRAGRPLPKAAEAAAGTETPLPKKKGAKKKTKPDLGGGLLADGKDGGGLLAGDKDSGGGLLSGGNDGGGGLLSGGKDGSGLLSDGKDGGGLLAGDKDSGGGLLSGGKDGGGLLLGDLAKEGAAPAAKEPPAAAAEPVAPAGGEEWSAAGGWYGEDLTLRYRPTGHADRFMKAWLDMSGSGGAGLSQAARSQIFEALAAANAPGICAKCHSIDASADGTLAVNWQGRRPETGVHRFTTFSHSAHFSLLDRTGCLNCHEPKEQAKYAVSYKDRDPTTFDGNFWTIERQDCARCHTKAEAGDGCLTCHNYHVGTFPQTVVNTEGMTQAAPAPDAPAPAPGN